MLVRAGVYGTCFIAVLTTPAVVLDDVTRSFDTGSEIVYAVRDASLRIERGTFTCLFGASGSGKSTLLNLVAGLDSPTSGTVTVLGSDVGSLTEDARARLRLERVGVVFQDGNLIEEFTAEENVMLPIEVRGAPASAARAQALVQLDRVGLSGLGSRYPAELSGGQRQRVGIARGLVGHRELLLADEPTGALDSANSQALFQLLRDLADDGMTIVLATHELRSREFADVLFEMRDGEPVETAVAAR